MVSTATSILLVLLLLVLVATMGLLISNGGITSAMTTQGIACFEDKDCDDQIAETEDLCRNPGTEYALCVNKPLK